MNSASEHAELGYWRRLIPPAWSRSAYEQLFQLRELFGQPSAEPAVSEFARALS